MLKIKEIKKPRLQSHGALYYVEGISKSFVPSMFFMGVYVYYFRKLHFFNMEFYIPRVALPEKANGNKIKRVNYILPHSIYHNYTNHFMLHKSTKNALASTHQPNEEIVIPWIGKKYNKQKTKDMHHKKWNR